jgi:hypothetical protein
MTSNSKPKPQAKTSQAEPKPAPAIIVFGADEANKPRAATFTGDEVEAATKAAGLMKLRVLNVAGRELTELAARLERGRIYASGHGFVPPIRPNIYERLCELVDPKPALSLPRSWDGIDVGHLVLATEAPGEGYWESIVVAKDNDMLTLRWRDYPNYPQFVSHRTTVGLLKPSAVKPSTAA